MITAIFTDETANGVLSAEFQVAEQATVGCDVPGDERFTVYREVLGGGFKRLTANGKTVQLSRGQNEVGLVGPKKYKLESLTQGAAISAWVEE